MSDAYPDSELLIAGVWRRGGGDARPVLNPATGQRIGWHACADAADLDETIVAAERGFRLWSRTPPHDRYLLLRRAADLMRERHPVIARWMTLEQGKPLAQSLGESGRAADLIDWFAEEARRIHGRQIPARMASIDQIAQREAIGPVAAFTPWNFPVNQAVRKIAAALAAGCSIILKGPEDTPASCAALVGAFHDAGLPAGVLNLVYGEPAVISDRLIRDPRIRKVSFTGSTVVGKMLAALAGRHMKPVTMELGGHSPFVIFDDIDVDRTARLLATTKFMNAGQVCTSPNRILVQDGLYDRFATALTQEMRAINVGDGMLPETTMGPLVSARRVTVMEELITDATAKGARVQTGGERLSNAGSFFQPTLLTDLDLSARVVNEEPFGPVIPLMRFSTLDDAITEANRLPYGLAAYAHTRDHRIARRYAAEVQSGMVAINHQGLGLPETPFGGIRDSGFGTEGGAAALDPYLVTKFVTMDLA